MIVCPLALNLKRIVVDVAAIQNPILSFYIFWVLKLFYFQDLRSKNRKATEALNELEQKYVKVLKETQK